MKAAMLTVFAVVWSGSIPAAGIPAEANPGYLNYDYPSETAGGPFNLMRTGVVTEAGIYEPGYVNYRYPRAQTSGARQARTGKWLDSGVFEPIYVNYRVGRK